MSSSSCCRKNPDGALREVKSSKCETEGQINVEESTRRRQEVQDYYGKVLKRSADLKTNVCTSGGSCNPLATTNYGATIRRILQDIHPEVIDKYYGCSVEIPECLGGARVLDVGCGSGRDCFLFSKLVGEEGQVTGVDMTEEQLKTARKFIQYHTEKFGYKRTNVDFVHTLVEDLAKVGIQSDYYDLIVSNCVVNLSPDKKRVLLEVYRSLKIGGEFYFSDIYADRRLSKELQQNEMLWGECLSGALYWKDFVQLVTEVGFSEPRLVRTRPTDIANEAIISLLGEARFATATYRLFKLPSTYSDQHPTAERVIYLGTIEGFPKSLSFDYHNEFKVGIATATDPDAIAFLRSSRHQQHFEFVGGDRQTELKLKKKQNINPFDA